jgi:hypothetical protein
MTPEERAQIARENGAKSHGPTTEAGKAKSSRNAIKSGEHATKLEMFVPPHSAVLCNEERQRYATLVEELLGIYRPVNSVALAIVKSIAIANWEISRLRACITMHWNMALINAGQKPSTLAPELLEMESMVAASTLLYAPSGPVRQLNRQIDQLELRIARLERRLKFIHTNFANTPIPQPVENTTNEPAAEPNTGEFEPPIVVTETNATVIEAYKKLYPNREIVVLPPDDVALGIEIEDTMPTAPRKAA